MSKINRKKLLSQNDEFIDFSAGAVIWCKENYKLLIAGLSVLVVLLAAVVGWQAYVDHRDISAAQAMAEAYAPYAQAVERQQPEETEAAAKGLAQVADLYGSAPAGVQARLALAGLYMQQQKYPEAQGQYEILSTEDTLPMELVPLVWHGLGQALEAQMYFKRATAAYQKAIDLAGPAQAAGFKLDQARAYEAAGEKNQAKQLYENFIREDPSRSGAAIAQSRLVAMGVDVTRLFGSSE